MAAITLKLPEDLAERLRLHADRLPEIIERGLRGIEGEAQGGFSGVVDVLEFLAGLPNPQEILELRPSEYLAHRIQSLLEKNRSGGLSPQEEKEWENYEFLEHLVRIAKIKAHAKLGLKPPSDG